MTSRVHPDFFIVGAPKCGTTSLYTYLESHPGIFMSPVKEPYHFCPDLHIGLPTIADRERYLDLFRGATAGERAGEASVWYLYSSRAARLIREFNPAARIIIMLRSPADMAYSLYNHYRYSGVEPLASFEEALAAEAERREGRRLPARRDVRETLYYREVARYAPQVKRYLDEFGRDRVHVILFDNLRDRTEAVYRDTLAFLGVESGIVAPDFDVVNEAKRIGVPVLHRLLSRPAPAALKSMVRGWPAGRRFRRWLRRTNARLGPKVEMAPETRRRLERELRADVEALGDLIGCDLSAWTASQDASA
jgi:hypothetical protein